MDYGGNMKGSKKKPAKINKPHWDIVFGKMKKLCTGSWMNSSELISQAAEW